MRPDDGEVPKMLARLYHRAGDPLKAIAELEQHIERNPGMLEQHIERNPGLLPLPLRPAPARLAHTHLKVHTMQGYAGAVRTLSVLRPSLPQCSLVWYPGPQPCAWDWHLHSIVVDSKSLVPSLHRPALRTLH